MSDKSIVEEDVADSGDETAVKAGVVAPKTGMAIK